MSYNFGEIFNDSYTKERAGLREQHTQVLNRQLQLLSLKLNALEADKQREFTTSERLGSQKFNEDLNKDNQVFTAGENTKKITAEKEISADRIAADKEITGMNNDTSRNNAKLGYNASVLATLLRQYPQFSSWFASEKFGFKDESANQSNNPRLLFDGITKTAEQFNKELPKNVKEKLNYEQKESTFLERLAGNLPFGKWSHFQTLEKDAMRIGNEEISQNLDHLSTNVANMANQTINTASDAQAALEGLAYIQNYLYGTEGNSETGERAVKGLASRVKGADVPKLREIEKHLLRIKANAQTAAYRNKNLIFNQTGE
jgi:hypothetical protein